MGKVRVLKQQNRSFVELPPELRDQQEMEIFQLREGYYLLTVPLGQQTGQKEDKQTQPAQSQSFQPAKGAGEAGSGGPGMGESERMVLRKLLAIRFEMRTPANVARQLSKEELELLKQLERRGFVNVFRGSKYKDGVYNISDSIYPLLSQRETTASSPSASPQRPQQPASYPDSFGLLNSRGYLIIADKNEARNLSDRFQQEMKSGAVVGVKGFDGKFYVVTRNYFEKSQETISAVLKEDMSVDAIATAGKLDADGCRAVLRLMAENGEVIEKRRGIFAPV